MEINAILKQLCIDLHAFTAAVMLPDYEEKVLKTVYSYNLHPSWTALTNQFDLTTNNGTAFTSGKDVIKNHVGQKHSELQATYTLSSQL